MDLVEFAWAGLGATFSAAVVLSLYWKRTTRNGIVAGIVIGSATAIIWRYLGLSGMMNEILPGVILSALAIYVTSLFDQKPQAEISQEFESVLQAIVEDAT